MTNKEVHFITYGDNKYANAKARLLNEAKDFYDFKTITGYGLNDLDVKFKKRFKNILNQPRGGGYWIWKPYILYKKFMEIKDNEYLVYLDAGCKLNKQGINRFNEYIDLLDNSKYGILSFQMTNKHNQGFCRENEWTVKEIFEYFNLKIDGEHGNSAQFVGGVLIIKKNQHSKIILETYLKSVFNNPIMFSDYFNKNNQATFFKDNRHDQSVFSLIRKTLGTVIIDGDESCILPWGSKESLKYPFWAMRSRN